MAREHRSTVSVSIPDSLLTLMKRLSLQSGDNLSITICKLLCKSMSINTDIVTDGARKRLTYEDPIAISQIKHTEAPWPNDLYELMQTKYRPRIHYNILLSKERKRWGVHDPGKKCPADCSGLDNDKNHPPITEQEKQSIKTLRDTYAYEY